MKKSFEQIATISSQLSEISKEGLKVQDSPWSILSSIGTFLAVVVALVAIFLPIHLRWRKRSILKIEFSNSEPFCRHVFGTVDLITRQGVRKNLYFIRLRVKNKGKSLARGCQGELIAIAHKDLKSLRKDFDPVVLNWVGSDKVVRGSSKTSSIITESIKVEKTLTKDINSMEYQYLDLISMEEGREKIDILAVDRDIPRGITLDPDLDDYFILVTIYSENSDPVSEIFKIEKGNSFDNLKLFKATSKEKKNFYSLLA